MLPFSRTQQLYVVLVGVILAKLCKAMCLPYASSTSYYIILRWGQFNKALQFYGLDDNLAII